MKKIEGEKVNFRGSLIIGDGYEKGKLILYSPFTRKVLRTFNDFHNTEIYRVKYFSENNISYVGFSSPDFGVWIFDMLQYNLYKLGSHASYSQGLDHIEIKGSGGRLASAGMDNTVRIWDVSKNKYLHIFKDHSNAARQVHFLDERTLFSSSYPKELIKYDLEKLVCVETVKHDYFWDFTIHKDRNMVVGAGYGNDLNPFNAGSKKTSVIDLKNLSKVIKILPHEKPIYPICVASNGDILVGTNVTRNNSISQWECRTFKLKNEFIISEPVKKRNEEESQEEEEEGGIKGIVDIPERKSFASCVKGKLIQIWDYEKNSNQKVVNFHSPYSCYGMDYCPLISSSHQQNLREHMKTSEEVYEILMEDSFSDVTVLGLKLWKSIFQRDDFENVLFSSSHNQNFDELDERTILQTLFPVNININDSLFFRSSSSSKIDDDNSIFQSPKSMVQHYEFFRVLDMVYGMKRIIQEISEMRNISRLLELIEISSDIISFDVNNSNGNSNSNNTNMNNMLLDFSSSSALLNECLNSLKKMTDHKDSGLWTLEYNHFNHQKLIIEFIEEKHIIKHYSKHEDFTKFFPRSEEEEDISTPLTPVIIINTEKNMKDDGEEIMSQSYNNHREFEYYSNQLNKDRLESKKYVNLILYCSGGDDDKKNKKKFYCHKEVLALRSEFFFRMFRFGGQEMQEMSDTGEITLQLLDSETLGFYLDYMYYQDLRFSKKDESMKKKDDNDSPKVEKGVNEKEEKFKYLEIILHLIFHSDMFGEWDLQSVCSTRFLEVWNDADDDIMSISDCRWWVMRFGNKIKENLNVKSFMYPLILTRLDPDDEVVKFFLSGE